MKPSRVAAPSMSQPTDPSATSGPPPGAAGSPPAGPSGPEKWSVDLEERVSRDMVAAIPVFKGDGAKPVWSIDTPPPYPSGKWHIGAVAGYSLIDMVARAKRMEGFDVLFPWGVDRNGINIELTLEKKSGKRMQEWSTLHGGPVQGRQAFIEACAAEIAVFSDDMKRIAQRVGLSCDYDGPLSYATDSPEYRAFSQACFLDLFAKGFIVEDLRPNAYDAKLGTAIADADIFYEERKTRLNDVKWTVKQTGEGIVISTTRPELICACRAVLVHPDNEATKHLIGKHAVLPAGVHGRMDTVVPIVAHPHVKIEFGSGIMMVCSYGDQADVGLFRELKLEAIAAIGMDGKMTPVAGPLTGLKVEEARKKAIELLEASGLMAGHKETDQKFPKSERSGAAVELILLKEWYVKQTHCTDDLRRIAHEMEFHPAKHRQLLLDWIDTVTIDWPISRRRWYHTEIPLWELKPTGFDEPAYLARGAALKPLLPCTAAHDGRHAYVLVVPKSSQENPAYFQPWKSDPPADSRLVCRECRADLGEFGPFMAARVRGTERVPEFRTVGEQKVFDTWMDSSVSNLYILRQFRKDPRTTANGGRAAEGNAAGASGAAASSAGGHGQAGQDGRAAPWWGTNHVCSVRPQGRDIVRTWLYYTTLKTWLLSQPPSKIPGKAFEHAWITGLGMDKQGRKMSKSLGNVIDPDEVVKKVGSDAFRLWIAGESTVGDDFRINEEKIVGAGKYLQKLANVASFVAKFEQPARPAKLHAADTWILGELDAVRAESLAAYQALDFFTPANAVRNFVWNVFAPHYLEMVKGRAYAKDTAACWTLHHVMRTVLALQAPVAPFSSHYYTNALYGHDVHTAGFPEAAGVERDPAQSANIVAFNSDVWKRKQEQGLSLGAPIAGVPVPPGLKPFEAELRDMHKLQ